MRLLLADNVHLYKDSKGNYYAPSIYNYNFLQRYLKVFEDVRFIGKVKYADNLDYSKYNLVSGKGIEIVELPWYQGLGEMKKEIRQILKIYRHASDECDCYILRVAQMESFFVYLFRKKNKPYAVEVVNDPDTFTDMPYLMKLFTVYLFKKIIWNANGASYVTQHFLQEKYPIKKRRDYFESYYSSVELTDEDIITEPIEYDGNSTFRIVHVSNAINGDVKGHRTLINASKKILDFGYVIEVICIGDGTQIDEFRSYCKELHVDDNVKFIGKIQNHKKLLTYLRTCNLMVLPTKMEGLPRTIIEGMAVGLPCISTPIAGIPELLDSKYLFDPLDSDGFANEIIRLINTPQELYQMSQKNIKIAENYKKEVLEKRRIEFYSNLKQIVQYEKIY